MIHPMPSITNEKCEMTNDKSFLLLTAHCLLPTSHCYVSSPFPHRRFPCQHVRSVSRVCLSVRHFGYGKTRRTRWIATAKDLRSKFVDAARISHRFHGSD